MNDQASDRNPPPEAPSPAAARGITSRGVGWARNTVSDVGPGLFMILGLEILVFWRTAHPYFLTQSNFIEIGKRMTIIGIAAVGETFVIIAGGFDLSVGSVAAMASVGSAWVVDNGGSLVLSVLAALAIGALIGVVNGAITGYGRINPLITTLGTFAIVRGLAYVLTDNKQITVSHEGFQNLGKHSAAGLPYIVWILLGTYVVFGLIIPRYRFGRYMYAIGSNERAAALAGVHVNRWKLVFYGVSGMMAGLAGLVNATRLGTGIPSSSIGLELAVITAVILGGASLLGGRGRLLGTFLGVLFLSCLLTGLIQSGAEPEFQRVAQGSALILAVLFDEWRRGRLSRG